MTSGSLDIEFRYIYRFCILWSIIEQALWLKSRAAQNAVGEFAFLSLMKDYLSPENSLFELIRCTVSRVASDPRDLIYGLVSLASDKNPLPFTPTYEITIDYLFEEFATYVIR